MYMYRCQAQAFFNLHNMNSTYIFYLYCTCRHTYMYIHVCTHLIVEYARRNKLGLGVIIP